VVCPRFIYNSREGPEIFSDKKKKQNSSSIILKLHKRETFFGSDFELYYFFGFNMFNIKVLYEKNDLAIIQVDTIFPRILSIR
jgi:hypothetical protein